jgi:hypothetical protein
VWKLGPCTQGSRGRMRPRQPRYRRALDRDQCQRRHDATPRSSTSSARRLHRRIRVPGPRPRRARRAPAVPRPATVAPHHLLERLLGAASPPRSPRPGTRSHNRTRLNHPGRLRQTSAPTPKAMRLDSWSPEPNLLESSAKFARKPGPPAAPTRFFARRDAKWTFVLVGRRLIVDICSSRVDV